MFITTRESSLRTQLCDENEKLLCLEYEEIYMDWRGQERLYEGYTVNTTGGVDVRVGGNEMN